MSPAGAAAAKFHKAVDKRDWGLWAGDLADAFTRWFAIVGAVLIGLFVIGLPLFLLVADHVSALNILSGP